MQSCAVAIIVTIYLRITIASDDHAFQGFSIPCNDTSSRCLKESIQVVLPNFARGIPSLGIDSLDPFEVEKINLVMPGGLNIEFNDSQTKGLRNCIIDTASVIENQFNVVLHCNFTIKGKYRSRGKMYMFPIDGEGDATIICKNLEIECSFKLGTSVRSGMKYLVLKKYDVIHSYRGQIFYKITNLFKGSPEISNMVLEFMNRNWLAIAEEFGEPIINFGIQTIIHNVNKLIKTVPADQLVRLN